MYGRLLLAGCAVLVLTAPTAAQMQSAARAPVEHSVVHVSVLSRLTSAPDALPQVPSVVLERVSSERNLASLSAEQSDNRAGTRLRLDFVFESEAEFRRWQESASTRQLLDLLRRNGMIELYRLDLRRFPLAGAVATPASP